MSETELAWAAGFFDGEGSTVRLHTAPGRRQSVSLRLVVPQKDASHRCLLRFQRALGGVGKIYPRALGVDQWVLQRRELVDFALTCLWPYLSEPKRQQAMRAGFVFGTIVRAKVGRPKGAEDRQPRRVHAA